MFDLILKVQKLREYLREQQFSRYARQGQDLLGDLAAFLEQLEAGGGILVGGAGEDLAAVEAELGLLMAEARGYAAVRCAGVQLVEGAPGPELDPATVIAIVELIIRVVRFIRERRAA